MSHEAFKARLVAAGGELLAVSPGNPYEVLRFRTKYGVGVVYAGRRGETWNREALAAKEHLADNLGSLARVRVVKARNTPHERLQLRKRDGDLCFFCLEPLGDDETSEHLVPRAHGGPNHQSNKFLAHSSCNSNAGHLSAPEKIRIREEALLRHWLQQRAVEA